MNTKYRYYALLLLLLANTASADFLVLEDSFVLSTAFRNDGGFPPNITDTGTATFDRFDASQGVLTDVSIRLSVIFFGSVTTRNAVSTGPFTPPSILPGDRNALAFYSLSSSVPGASFLYQNSQNVAVTSDGSVIVEATENISDSFVHLFSTNPGNFFGPGTFDLTSTLDLSMASNAFGFAFVTAQVLGRVVYTFDPRVDPPPSDPVPEPSVLMLVGLGLLCAGLARRRRPDG